MGELGLVFLVGLIFGSFANVLIYRLNDERAPRFWQGRSRCPKCKRNLLWYDNIPLLSFLILKGKCRFCTKPISWQYPVVELLIAILFVLGWLVSAGSPLLVRTYYEVIIFTAIVIFFSDLIYGLIPDEMVVLGTVAAILVSLVLPRTGPSGEVWLVPQMLTGNLVVGLVSALGFLAIVLITKFRGMGLGDVKLAFLLGLILGWPAVLVGFWVAFVTGGVAATSLLMLKRTTLSATIALGPFLIIGSTIAALWSEKLLAFIGL